jgi:two-component system sensor histidine kinase DegS
VGLSIEIARFYRQMRTSARREEASYLALELHDALQVLFYEVISRAGSSLDELRRNNLSAAERNLRIIESAAKYCIGECHSIVGLLHKPVVVEFGLVEALRQYTTFHPENLSIQFQVNGRPRRLCRTAEHHIYRIAQEGLHNAISHSLASRIGVELEFGSSRIRLMIRDDGTGFKTEDVQDADTSFGLRGMKWRVERLKGELEIDSRPGKGTCLRVSIPMKGVTRNGTKRISHP